MVGVVLGSVFAASVSGGASFNGNVDGIPEGDLVGRHEIG